MPHQRARINHSAPSLVVPAVRMVVVEVSLEADDRSVEHVEVMPVLALRSFVRETSTYSRDDKILLDHFESEVIIEALICPGDEGVQSVEDYYYGMRRVAYQVVACAWDPREDADRFRPIIEDLKREVARWTLRTPAAQAPSPGDGAPIGGGA